MDQVIQIIGAALILVPFAAAQFGRMALTSVPYLLMNLAGSAILTGVALHAEDWGFFMLEFVWAIVSAWGLAAALRGQTPKAAH